MEYIFPCIYVYTLVYTHTHTHELCSYIYFDLTFTQEPERGVGRHGEPKEK
jgi:hypothetical protein